MSRSHSHDGQFDFNDRLAQMRMMKKMGGLQDLVGMIPADSTAPIRFA